MLRASGNKLKPEDSLRIQKDVYSGFNKFLARQLVAAYGHRNGPGKMFTDAMAMLRTWDGQMDQNRAEPLIVTLAYQYLRKAVAERASPGNGEIYDAKLAPAVIERLLRDRPAAWFGDYNQLLLQCFADGMEEGRRMQGPDPKRWKWGKFMFLTINNPVVNRVPMVGKYFNIGPVPMSGGPTTVKQTTPNTRAVRAHGCFGGRLGRFAAESADRGIGPRGIARIIRDEWDAYYNGKSFPMQFNRLDVKSTVRFVPER